MIHTKAVDANVQAISPSLNTVPVDDIKSPAEQRYGQYFLERSRRELTRVVGDVHHFALR